MSDYLESSISQYPDLSPLYTELQSLHSTKLWHELTESLTSFISNPANHRDGNANIVALYNSFVLTFDSKLNQLALAKIASLVADSYGSSDLQSAATLLQSLLSNRERLGPIASLYLDARLSLLNVRRNLPLAPVKKTLSECKSALDDLQGLDDPTCHSAYYMASKEYYRVQGPPEAFYKNALMYLSYTPADKMSPEEAKGLAVDLSMAALTGEGVYNFGEVVQTPVLKALEGTEDAWLVGLMVCFAEGDVNAFNKVMAEAKMQVEAKPALYQRLGMVTEKIKLLAVVNMVFERESNDRTIAFREIEARAQVKPDEVEWLVMRALSLGLIKGSMDQVEETVEVSWVMPRVLSQEQTKAMADKLAAWSDRVKEMKNFMTDNTAELFT